MAGSRPGGGWCCLPVVILIGFSHPKARYFDSESPGFAFRGEPAHRGGDSLDRRLFPARPWSSPCGSPAATIFTTGVPPPYDGFLSLHAQRKEPKERVPRTLRPKNRLESPVRTVRGAPARRGGDSPDPRLLSGSPLCLGRTRGSLPRHFVLGLRSSSSLGLSKGV
jgi:hypothetical protein